MSPDRSDRPSSRLFKARAAKAPAPQVEPVALPAGLQIASAWSWRLLLIIALVGVVLFLIVQLRLVVIPLLIAVLISALLVPFSNFLQRHGWPKWLSVLTAMLALIVVVGGLLTLGVSQVVRGSADLAAESTAAWNEFLGWLHTGPLGLTDAQIDDGVKRVLDSVNQDSKALWTGALSFGSTLGHVAAGLLLTLFSTLFMVIDGRGIWGWLVSIFPHRARAAVSGAATAGWSTLQNFVKVQILVATIDAIGIGLGAFFLGVPLALPIAVLVFLGSFIPIVGAVATGALAVFVALIFNSPVHALIMLGIVLLVQQLEGHVLQPLIMGTAVKVHPLGVVLAVATGSLLAGIPGALFAVPVAAFLNVFISYIARGAWKQHPEPSTPPGTPLWTTVPVPRKATGS